MVNTKVGQILSLLMGDMSEAALARAVKLPKATIHRVLSGSTPDPRAGTLLPIAQYFNISIEQLIGIIELPKNCPLQSTKAFKEIKIPFVNFSQLKNWEEGEYVPQNFLEVSSFGNKTIDSNCFVTKLDSDEMAPVFSNNTYLIVTTKALLKADDIIIVFNNQNDQILVRKYVLLKGEKYLISSNPSYDIINFDKKIKFIGVVIEGRIII